MLKSVRNTLVVSIATLAIAVLAGGTAHAQKTSSASSGGGASTSSSTAGAGGGERGSSTGEGGRVITYGTSGNCPPTIACTQQERPRRQVVRARVHREHCEDWVPVYDEYGRRQYRCLIR